MGQVSLVKRDFSLGHIPRGLQASSIPVIDYEYVNLDIHARREGLPSESLCFPSTAPSTMYQTPSQFVQGVEPTNDVDIQSLYQCEYTIKIAS